MSETTGGTPCPVCGAPTWTWANHICGPLVGNAKTMFDQAEPITHGPTGLINWKARALAAESKLARLEGLERAARAYCRSPKTREDALNATEAMIAYVSENPE